MTATAAAMLRRLALRDIFLVVDDKINEAGVLFLCPALGMRHSVSKFIVSLPFQEKKMISLELMFAH